MLKLEVDYGCLKRGPMSDRIIKVKRLEQDVRQSGSSLVEKMGLYGRRREREVFKSFVRTFGGRNTRDELFQVQMSHSLPSTQNKREAYATQNRLFELKKFDLFKVIPLNIECILSKICFDLGWIWIGLIYRQKLQNGIPFQIYEVQIKRL